jgi:hypothetical protein
LKTAALTAPLDLPRASPKVPTYEYYGFVLYLLSSLCFIIYLLWSYLPSPFLHLVGIHYYPNRWWSIAIPAWLVVAVSFGYVALGLYNTERLTLGVGDLRGVVDGKGWVAVLDERGRIVRAKAGGHRDGRQERKSSAESKKSEKRKGSSPAPDKIDWRKAWSEGTDAVMDVPVGGVCEILYGDG